jgi:hypothetical protein
VTSRWPRWSVEALHAELIRTVAGAEVLAGMPVRLAEKVGKAVRLAEAIGAKGGAAAEGLDMASIDVLEAQLRSIAQQTAVALAMVAELKSPAGAQPAAPDLRVVKPVPSDPTVALRVEIAHFIAQGLSWDQFIDRCSQDLVTGSQRQFSEFGPGRGPGRRSVEGWRSWVMSGVATADAAGKAVA